MAAQVVYPALEAKVKNVTQAYSVEHEDEARTAPGCLGFIAKSPGTLEYLALIFGA